MNGKIGKTSRNLKHNRLIPYGGRVMRPLYFLGCEGFQDFSFQLFFSGVRQQLCKKINLNDEKVFQKMAEFGNLSLHLL